MRLDKFLKKSGLIKRRVIAHDLCQAEKVKKNGNPLKPSYETKIGDILILLLTNKILTIKIIRETEFEIINEEKNVN